MNTAKNEEKEEENANHWNSILYERSVVRSIGLILLWIIDFEFSVSEAFPIFVWQRPRTLYKTCDVFFDGSVIKFFFYQSNFY